MYYREDGQREQIESKSGIPYRPCYEPEDVQFDSHELRQSRYTDFHRGLQLHRGNGSR